ncbi:unnamed protein product [Plutella xylostella]|uniref:(diamondback moth) hypothetical protein n=1 Tax=Plutella xylostella TaxID=51655 RepID=A0A8S4EAX3_PLUXY|nr:unnamed protein product [Plutella xylostella]
MTSDSKEYLNSILAEVAKDQHIEEWIMTQKSFVSVADNFFGVVVPVALTGKVDHSRDAELDLVVKLGPEANEAVNKFFNRECFVYSTVLRNYESLQTNFSETSKFVIPKHYFICTEPGREAIVLENMCCKGYQPHCGGPFLDYEHMDIAMKSLAKFHALSFMMRRTDNALYKNIAEKCVSISYTGILLDNLENAKKLLDDRYTPVIQYLEDNCLRLLKAPYQEVKELVICHGDLWKDNILFKYNNQNQPVSACLIDYQTSRMRSPAYDIIYLLITSSTQDLRRIHYQQLLDIFYDTFQKMLEEGGLSAQVYSREDLEYDLKVSAASCLIVTNTVMWISLGLQEEGGIVKPKKVLTSEREKEEAKEKFKGIVQGIIDDFKRLGYL